MSYIKRYVATLIFFTMVSGATYLVLQVLFKHDLKAIEIMLVTALFSIGGAFSKDIE